MAGIIIWKEIRKWLNKFPVHLLFQYQIESNPGFKVTEVLSLLLINYFIGFMC
jgi:hypothetical protein